MLQESYVVVGPAGRCRLVVGWPFYTTIPRVVIVFAVPIPFAIGVIMFLIVIDQIVQGETIVRGDEVNRSVWSPAGGLIKVRTATQAVSDLTNQTRVSLPEPAYRVAIPPVHSAQRTGKLPIW